MLQWVNPNGTELWSSDGELGVAPPPAGVVEMDFPLIAQLDLPIDVAGRYVMVVGLDGATHAEVPVMVRTASAAPAQRTPTWMS
jgi:hypothetical protein